MLLISSELEEILALADRIVVIHAGRIRGEMARGDADIERIGLLMGGVMRDSASSVSWSDASDEAPAPPAWRTLSRWSGQQLRGPEVAWPGNAMRTVLLYVASSLGALALSALLVSATGGSAPAVWSALLDGSIRSPGRGG